MFAATPEPPYYACIFTSQKNDDTEGYDAMAERMLALASGSEGFLGYESARNPSGLGITVSYWSSIAAMQAWKENTEHLAAQRMGKTKWYQCYKTRICHVEADYGQP